MTSTEGGTAQPPVELQLPVETHLPVEVWQRVAGHMSSRCWAQVSRTCKAMHNVQPKVIGIEIGGESALAWLQTHWGQVSNMWLSWTKSDVPWVMAYSAASLTSLKVIYLGLLPEESPTTAMLLMWLLAQAPQLGMLVLNNPGALVVPPIRSLKRLALFRCTQFTPAVAASIRQLRNLQCLWLGMEDNLHPGNVCAELDLASLAQLSNVCITFVPLPRIALPRHCRLHLVGDDNMMELDTWCDVARHGQLSSITRRSQWADNMPASVLQLDCSVLNWGNIKELGRYSSPAVFRAQGYRCLTYLRLEGEDIHIMLPQELPLKVLHVEAKSLSVVCGNPQEQAKRLQQLQATYRL